MQESEEGGHLQSSSEEGGGLEALLRVSREEGGMDESSKALCREMFEKVTEYLNGELAGLQPLPVDYTFSIRACWTTAYMGYKVSFSTFSDLGGVPAIAPAESDDHC